jgi:hypothetical protein
MHAGKMNQSGSGVSAVYRFSQVRTGRSDAEDAATCGFEGIPAELGTRMKDRRAGSLRWVNAGDGAAGVEFSRISSRRHHDANGGPGTPIERYAAQLSNGRGEKDRGEVASQAMHDRLSFGITQADIIFEDLRAARSHHQPRIEESGELRGCNSRPDDGVEDTCGFLVG